MASDINRVILIGRLVRDPEIRYTQSGTSFVSFSIASNYSYKQGNEKKEQVSFLNCVAWTKLGELINQYCKKGDRIGIDGRLQQRTWEEQNGNKRSTVDIVVENVQFLTPKQGGQANVQESFAGEQVIIPDSPFDGSDLPPF